jgi:hypothetical protein
VWARVQPSLPRPGASDSHDAWLSSRGPATVGAAPRGQAAIWSSMNRDRTSQVISFAHGSRTKWPGTRDSRGLNPG